MTTVTPFHSSLFPHLDPPENPGFINSHRGPFTPHTSSPSASPAKGEGCCPGHREHSRCSLLVIGQSSTFGPVEWPHVPPSQCPSVSVAFFSACRSPQTLGLLRGPAPCPLGPSPACQPVWCVASEPGCGCVCPGGVFTLQTLPDLPGATQKWSVPAALSEAKSMVVPKQ